MPELPEVETTVNELKPQIVGRRIKSVEVFAPKTIAIPSPDAFIAGLRGSTVTEISRRGKHLVFTLDNNLFLIIHLRMTGSLIVNRSTEPLDKFVRVLIKFEGGQVLHFRDVRRFGRMWLVEDPAEVVGKLGIEPLSGDFSVEYLSELLKGRQTPVKSFLINQKLIAGIGNMYADEALYNARLHPLRTAASLNTVEISDLHKAIRFVLKKGIRGKGASTDTYFRPSGDKGSAHLEFVVAHRKGESCPCGGTIERIVVQQRGTFFCPQCQKLKRSRSRSNP